MNSNVVIVQPYVPTYRQAFFERLSSTLSEKGVGCHVVAGTPGGDQKRRGDAVQPAWLTTADAKSITIRGRTVVLGSRNVPWKGADAVILGLRGTSIPVYRSLLTSSRGSLRVGLWGHVKPYVNRGSKIDLQLESYQMRFANHIFAYTPGGADYAVGRGIESTKITTVMNTVDTAGIQHWMNALTPREVEHFAEKHDIDLSRTVAFIGGMDASKRVNFLAESLDYIWQKDPSIKIIVGGMGADMPMLEESIGRGQAIALGYLDGPKKALALRSCRAICMPGRIGLIAVDALVAKVPIITTDWNFHAPESEYLVEGESKLTAPNTPADYGTRVIEYLEDSEPINFKSELWQYPTMGDMVSNFSSGVLSMLDSKS